LFVESFPERGWPVASTRLGCIFDCVVKLTFCFYAARNEQAGDPSATEENSKQGEGLLGPSEQGLQVAKHAVEKGLQYAYRDRRQKKRRFRRLWITRINAATRQHDVSYSQFMGQYRKSDLDMNRKVLADLAVHDPDAFEQIVDHVME
jgi:ribosomal protein L20